MTVESAASKERLQQALKDRQLQATICPLHGEILLCVTEKQVVPI